MAADTPFLHIYENNLASEQQRYCQTNCTSGTWYGYEIQYHEHKTTKHLQAKQEEF